MKSQKALLILSASAMLGGQSSRQTSRWSSHFPALLPAALLLFPQGNLLPVRLVPSRRPLTSDRAISVARINLFGGLRRHFHRA
jgi:hypothetical protein